MCFLCRSWRLRGGVFGILLLIAGAAQGGAPDTKHDAGRTSAPKSSPSDLKLTRPAKRQPAVSPEEQGELIDRVERQYRTAAEFSRAEVRHAIKQACALSATDPEQAEHGLKLLRDKVARTRELEPAMRARLIERIVAESQSVRRMAQVLTERRLRTRQSAAEREAQERIYRELAVQDQQVDQLMTRHNALMDERRYTDAEAVAAVAEGLKPGRAGLRGAELTARMAGYTANMNAVRDLRHRGFVATTRQIELALVPTPDEPPITYPDPETWQLLTERRKKYKAVDLTQHGPNEARILAALDERTELDFVDQPLNEVMEYLKQRHDIEIQIDARALADAGVGSDTPITRSIKGITLRSALKLILGELDLTYVIRNEVLLITTKTEADNMLTTRVYPVADLVVPIRPATSMGGMGGMFGSSGGMGRMGMGMGGMGMGGMGMGGMGMGMMPGMGMGGGF